MEIRMALQVVATLGVFLLLPGQGELVGAEPKPPEFAALLHLPFDGSAAASIPNTGVTVAGEDGLRFAEGLVGQAADFRQGGCLEYRGLPPLDPRSGTLELSIKPAHDRSDRQDHYYLQFFDKGGTPVLEVKFYHPNLAPQVTIWAGGRTYRRYGWSFDKDLWNHLVITWDSVDPDLSGLGLFKAGEETGYPAAYAPMPIPQRLRIGCKSPEEGLPATALVDEVTLYNRSLTRTQVKVLSASGKRPLAEKVALVRQQIARDDLVKRERQDRLFNHCKLGIVHGLRTSLVNWPDSAFKTLQIPVPDKIYETDLEKADLKRYHVLLVPGGGGLDLTEPNKAALHRYVREGGGYVGICGGGVTAQKYGLIDARQYKLTVHGTVTVSLQPHPITEGYLPDRPIQFPHAGGPLWVTEEKTQQTIIAFHIGGPPLPPFAHTIVRRYGQGRVVAFSGHPEGASDTRPLVRNAILWAAKIIGADDPKEEH